MIIGGALGNSEEILYLQVRAVSKCGNPGPYSNITVDLFGKTIHRQIQYKLEYFKAFSEKSFV